MKRWKNAVFAALVAGGPVAAADRDGLYRAIKGVGPDGAGSGPAAAAWAELKKQPADAIVPTLAAMDGATPLAVNWLRSAVDAMAERERAAGRKLPTAELEKFTLDRSRSPVGRRLAFELLGGADPTARERLLPKFLDDPAPELRFDAVETAFNKLRQLPKPDPEADDDKNKPGKLAPNPTAVAELRKLMAASRHFGQTAEIARELEAYGEKVDLTTHFGFLRKWRVLSAFDNTDEKGFATAYPPEVRLDLNATPPGKGGEPTKWTTIDSAEQYATVDLNKRIGKLKNVVAYAVAEVESPDARDVEIRIASATGIKVFVNGVEKYAAATYHQSFTPDTHVAPARLNAGRNVILLKVCQNDQKEPWAQDWKFQLRVTDAAGARVPLKEVTP